jgi:hypothetical protein
LTDFVRPREFAADYDAYLAGWERDIAAAHA